MSQRMHAPTRRLVLLVVGLAAVATIVGIGRGAVGAEEREPRIVNGQPAVDGQFPWQVGLFIDADLTPGGSG